MKTPLRYLTELPVGATLIEADGVHTWHHYPAGWFCLCGGGPAEDEEPWTWLEMIEDIGDLTYHYEVDFSGVTE